MQLERLGMIDKSDEVFTRVMNYIEQNEPSLTDDNFSSEYTDSPAVFPFVCIEQTDSTPLSEYQTDELKEQVARVEFTITIFSNREAGKNTECRKLATYADAMMNMMNFMKNTSAPVPNLNNQSIARYVSRYSVNATDSYFFRINRR